ncbi:hypothetical protein DFJ73DRAFT_850249 [Zopfochytrium polystomum]|nr:hypothetical protein DFJ73DRAFT_850249 [Zopfochytrium polystomum]
MMMVMMVIDGTANNEKPPARPRAKQSSAARRLFLVLLLRFRPSIRTLCRPLLGVCFFLLLLFFLSRKIKLLFLLSLPPSPPLSCSLSQRVLRVLCVSVPYWWCVRVLFAFRWRYPSARYHQISCLPRRDDCSVPPFFHLFFCPIFTIHRPS